MLLIFDEFEARVHKDFKILGPIFIELMNIGPKI
jgi:hypothetical protein